MTERHTALYRLLSKSGRLLYVGISGNPDSRWGTHSNNQPWWEEVADRKIEWFGSREAASTAEVEAIKEERPLYNKQHSVIGTPSAMISEPLDDPWADSGPADRLPAQTRHHRQDADLAAESVPPQDLDAEQSVLGAMMESNEVIASVLDMLAGADFYEPTHVMIYGAILDLYAKGEPADRITVGAELTRRGTISKVGGAGHLHGLVLLVPKAANATFYAEIVYERAVQRRLIEAGGRLTNLGRAFGVCAAKALELAQAEIVTVAGISRARAMGLLKRDEVYGDPTDRPTGARDELWDDLGIDPDRISREEFDEYLDAYDRAASAGPVRPDEEPT